MLAAGMVVDHSKSASGERASFSSRLSITDQTFLPRQARPTTRPLAPAGADASAGHAICKTYLSEMGVPRLRMEVRVILVSFRAALDKARPGEVQALRARAHGLIDDVRAQAASPEDHAVLQDAHASIERVEATDDRRATPPARTRKDP